MSPEFWNFLNSNAGDIIAGAIILAFLLFHHLNERLDAKRKKEASDDQTHRSE